MRKELQKGAGNSYRKFIYFSRGGEQFMKGIDRLSVVRHISETKKEWIHTELFRILRNDDIWIVAYENIKSNKGALTPGSLSETMDGMNITRLQRLRDEVVNEKYVFKPVKEIVIPKPDKPDGRNKSLSLPTANDKIVQEVIRMILEAIYEPCFSEQSFGFCKGLGPHDAFEYIERKSKFRWTNWIIEGNIEGAYPIIDHDRLCEILDKRIQDTRFMNLIRKFLKCGILCNHPFTSSSLGVPQGNIVSPILANIYYHELDEWVKEKAELLNQPPSTQKNTMHKKISYHISKISKKIKDLDRKSNDYKILVKELKSKKKEREKIPSLANPRIHMDYVRYADDWIIGVSGDKELAYQLKIEVSEFLEDHLKQKLHPRKTKVMDIKAGKAKFLGYEIYLPLQKKISPYYKPYYKKDRTRRTNCMLRFDIPQDHVLKRMHERGYIRKLPKGYFPTSKKSYTTLTDYVIVKHFQAVWKGIENYYSGCTNLQKLQYIHYLLRFSCAMTLAHRHRSSVKKIFVKHGKTLTVTEGIKTVKFPVRTEWSLKNRKWRNKHRFVDPFKVYANPVTRSSLNRKCLICHTKDRIEMHHVKHVQKEGIRYVGFHREIS
jgi:group II intron reverse transcriptase/maturase